MSVAGADISKAVNLRWTESALDNPFTDLWKKGTTKSEWEVLHSNPVASPAQPFPYVIVDIGAGTTTDRMACDGTSNFELRDIPVDFRVHARSVTGDSRTSREIAADLAEEIIKVFGGHPTVAPAALTLDNGNFLIAQYQTDFGLETGEDEHQWNISYLIKVDVPVLHS